MLEKNIIEIWYRNNIKTILLWSHLCVILNFWFICERIPVVVSVVYEDNREKCYRLIKTGSAIFILYFLVWLLSRDQLFTWNFYDILAYNVLAQSKKLIFNYTLQYTSVHISRGESKKGLHLDLFRSHPSVCWGVQKVFAKHVCF